MNRDLVLVKLEEVTKSTELILPEDVKESAENREIMYATTGTAEAIGPECEYVKEGDFIHYNSVIGNQIKDETLTGGIFIVVAERDILCKRKSKSAKPATKK